MVCIMILDRITFKSWIHEYEKYVPRRHAWESYTNNSIPGRPGAGFREQLKAEIPIDDIMICEMLDNISHSLLYHNIEFRKALRKRLDFYKNVDSTI